MDNGLGIDIEVKLDFNEPAGIPYDVFRRILNAIEAATFDSEIDDLNAILEVFPELEVPYLANELSRARWHSKLARTSSLIIKDIRNGSVVIECSVAALAIWFLRKTLGKAFEDAWLESNLNKKVRELLQKLMGGKVKSLTDSIVRNVGRSIPCRASGKNTFPNGDRPEETSRIQIVISITIDREKYPPERRDL